jgi:hypothetical protein
LAATLFLEAAAFDPVPFFAAAFFLVAVALEAVAFDAVLFFTGALFLAAVAFGAVALDAVFFFDGAIFLVAVAFEAVAFFAAVLFVPLDAPPRLLAVLPERPAAALLVDFFAADFEADPPRPFDVAIEIVGIVLGEVRIVKIRNDQRCTIAAVPPQRHRDPRHGAQACLSPGPDRLCRQHCVPYAVATQYQVCCYYQFWNKK